MVCVYCGGDTRVSNSRLQVKANRTWRRRVCLRCKNVFTTLEAAELPTTLLFKDKMGNLWPFERDILYISVYEACRHRKSPTSDSSSLVDTIVSKLMHKVLSATIDRSQVLDTVSVVLRNFDNAAYVHYQAYHPSN